MNHPASREQQQQLSLRKKRLKRSLKKVGKGENSGRKRQAKKNLREKRRSTGVVIMPNMDVSFENIF